MVRFYTWCGSHLGAAKVIGGVWLVCNILNMLQCAISLGNLEELNLSQDWKIGFQIAIGFFGVMVLMDIALIYGAEMKIAWILGTWAVITGSYSIFFMIAAIETGDPFTIETWVVECVCNTYAILNVVAAVHEIKREKRNVVMNIAA